MINIKRKINTIALKSICKLIELYNNGCAVLKNDRGAAHTTEILIWVLAVVVIAAIIVGLMILLIKNDIFPMLSEKIKEIFNMK